LVEDDRADAESAASWNSQGEVGLHVRIGGVQLGAHEESAGQFSWCRMSQGRSVPARGQNGKLGQQLQTLMPLTGSFKATVSKSAL
jgi:hypothetical protein